MPNKTALASQVCSLNENMAQNRLRDMGGVTNETSGRKQDNTLPTKQGDDYLPSSEMNFETVI